YRTMVTVLHIGKYRSRPHLLTQIFCNANIVYTPAFIIGSCISSEAPPTIFIFGIRMQQSERIDKSIIKPFVHPGALFGQESRAVFIAHWIVNVNGSMTNIIISADDKRLPIIL